jgi:hypothetical protein
LSTASLTAGKSEQSGASRVLRRIFSFPVVASSALAVLAVLTVRDRFDDPDMWWHLKIGEAIWTTHAIPTTDLFSYTTNHHGIVPQEWLSELLIYGAYRVGGFSGMMLWLCVFTTALLVAGYVLCSRYSGNAKVGFLGAMLVWFFSTGGLVVRPQVISYVLLVLELLLVQLGFTRNRRWFFLLPPLFALWVNCHGSFFLGIAVLGAILGCSLFSFERGGVACLRWQASQRRTLAIATLLSAAAVFLNPMGAKQVLYPLDTMLRQPLVTSQIDEWKPLLMSDPRAIVLLGVVAFVFLCVIVRRSERLYLHELALLAGSAWFALSHRRMCFAFGIFAAPVVTRLLSEAWDKYDPRRDRAVPGAVVVALAAMTAFFAFPSRQHLAKQVNDGNPVKAVSYIRTHNLTGNMLNSYAYGGYLIWAMPEHPVFIDGRSDLYEWAGVFREYGAWATLQSDPNKLLDKYHVKFCLIERDSPMAHVLPLMGGWKEVYSDNASVIFVKWSAGDSSTPNGV